MSKRKHEPGADDLMPACMALACAQPSWVATRIYYIHFLFSFSCYYLHWKYINMIMNWSLTLQSIDNQLPKKTWLPMAPRQRNNWIHISQTIEEEVGRVCDPTEDNSGISRQIDRPPVLVTSSGPTKNSGVNLGPINSPHVPATSKFTPFYRGRGYGSGLEPHINYPTRHGHVRYYQPAAHGKRYKEGPRCE